VRSADLVVQLLADLGVLDEPEGPDGREHELLLVDAPGGDVVAEPLGGGAGDVQAQGREERDEGRVEDRVDEEPADDDAADEEGPAEVGGRLLADDRVGVVLVGAGRGVGVLLLVDRDAVVDGPQGDERDLRRLQTALGDLGVHVLEAEAGEVRQQQDVEDVVHQTEDETDADEGEDDADDADDEAEVAGFGFGHVLGAGVRVGCGAGCRSTGGVRVAHEDVPLNGGVCHRWMVFLSPR